MSRRPTPQRKSTNDMLADLLAGHERAMLDGWPTTRKYLEKLIERQDSLANAVKFFAWDLLAEAAAETHDLERAAEAVEVARRYMAAAEEDTPREWRAWLPRVRCFEVGIGVAVDEGRFDDALDLCEAAVSLGLGSVYERKADSIRRMI
jgi:hypothetical protein